MDTEDRQKSEDGREGQKTFLEPSLVTPSIRDSTVTQMGNDGRDGEWTGNPETQGSFLGS